MSNTMPVALLDWKEMKRNSLRGFATIRLGKSLKISDVTIHCSHGKRWASLPSKPQVGSDGMVLKDQNGKIKYVPVISWTDKESADRFSEALIAVIEAQYPGATEGDYA